MAAAGIVAHLRERWVASRAMPWWGRVAPLLVAAALIAVGVLGAAALLDSVLERDDATRLDGPVSAWLVDHREGALTGVLTWVSAVFAVPLLPVLVASAAGLVAWRLRSWWAAGLLISASIAASVLSVVGKVLVGRDRPPKQDMVDPPLTSYAFPSGHTLAAATLMLVLGYLLWTSHRTHRFLLVWAGVSVVVVGAVGVSRLYLGYHWPTDVAASAFLSLAVLGCVIAADSEHAARTGHTPPER